MYSLIRLFVNTEFNNVIIIIIILIKHYIADERLKLVQTDNSIVYSIHLYITFTTHMNIVIIEYDTVIIEYNISIQCNISI